MNKKILSILILVAIVFGILGFLAKSHLTSTKNAAIAQMVSDHARAWETGDENLLAGLLDDHVVFAYPGRRLGKEDALADLRSFRDSYIDTKVYVHQVIVDGDNVAVEWQFATTKKETGRREVVSDAIIAKVKDGRFTVWKEYLDGRVKVMQADGSLQMEEGEEPFPWPKKIVK